MTWEAALDTLADHPHCWRFRQLANDGDPDVAAAWQKALPEIALEWLVGASIAEQTDRPQTRPQIPVKGCGSC